MLLKEWTQEEALSAHGQFVACGGSVSDPAGPYWQWWALNELDALEAQFKSGEKYVLAMAVRICASNVLPLPHWAAAAYIEGFDAVHTFQTGTWEKLFGPAIPKGRQLHPLRQRWLKAGAVSNEVQQRRATATAIDFDQLAKQFGISTTSAKEYAALELSHIENAIGKGGPISPFAMFQRAFRFRKQTRKPK
jgi:hypothetical protein